MNETRREERGERAKRTKKDPRERRERRPREHAAVMAGSIRLRSWGEAKQSPWDGEIGVVVSRPERSLAASMCFGMLTGTTVSPEFLWDLTICSDTANLRPVCVVSTNM